MKLNIWNYQVVKRGDGRYALRRGWIFHGYKAIQGMHWWEHSSVCNYQCWGSREEILNLQARLDKRMQEVVK